MVQSQRTTRGPAILAGVAIPLEDVLLAEGHPRSIRPLDIAPEPNDGRHPKYHGGRAHKIAVLFHLLGPPLQHHHYSPARRTELKRFVRRVQNEDFPIWQHRASLEEHKNYTE
jgi:hypothetical protein